MKRLVATIAIALFAAAAGADDVYRGLAKGSPDLHEPHGDQAVIAQPATADFAAFEVRPAESDARPAGLPGEGRNRSSTWARGIYKGFCGGNADLDC